MLDARLTSAAKYVRQGATFADVGTDHAYLPIYLLENKIIKSAVISDVNKGPLLRAEENVERAGLMPFVTLVLTDGARELSGYGITDVAICGMGGELIADIIEKAPWLKSEGVRLILQPMSKVGALRTYLSHNGFSVVAEDYSFADGKYYVALVAEYDGAPYALAPAEAELGKEELVERRGEEYLGYLYTRLSAYAGRIEGKRHGGKDFSEDFEIYTEIKRRIAKEEGENDCKADL